MYYLMHHQNKQETALYRFDAQTGTMTAKDITHHMQQACQTASQALLAKQPQNFPFTLIVTSNNQDKNHQVVGKLNGVEAMLALYPERKILPHFLKATYTNIQAANQFKLVAQQYLLGLVANSIVTQYRTNALDYAAIILFLMPILIAIHLYQFNNKPIALGKSTWEIVQTLTTPAKPLQALSPQLAILLMFASIVLLNADTGFAAPFAACLLLKPMSHILWANKNNQAHTQNKLRMLAPALSYVEPPATDLGNEGMDIQNAQQL